MVKQTKEPITLLIHVLPVSSTETQPTSRENAHAAENVNGIIAKGVFRASTEVLN